MKALNSSYFELFGLCEGFAIDRAALDSAFRRVQTAVHPDRFGTATDTERRIAMQLATQANEAYRTLRDPLLRAAYLCQLHGADPQVHSNTAMPGEFLLTQMEWREQLEALHSLSADMAGVRLEALRLEIEQTRAALIAELADALDGRREFSQAAGLVRQLMFVEKFGEDLSVFEDRLETN
jgi:molecular chaperone HscB